jgi:predicted amidohydrolase YtcJ
MSSPSMNRRQFIAGTGVLAAGVVLPGLRAGLARAARPRPTSAATVIRNGRVWTGTGAIAEAVAIGSNGKILAVGTNQDMSRFVGSRTAVVSAAGGTVISGIHDGHMHPQAVVNFLIYPDLGNAEMTLAELQQTLQGYLDDPDTVFPGGWLRVNNWNPVACPVDALPANKGYLDALNTDRPILLQGSDFHNVWVNSKALELAGITASTPDPEGGKILRDASGEPTGVLVDAAGWTVWDLIPEPPTQDKLPYMQEISSFMALNGITSFMDAASGPDGLDLYAALAESGGLLQRVRPALTIPEELFGDPRGAVAWAKDLAGRYAHVHDLSFGTVKIFLDGVMEHPAQTAALIDPYLDENGAPTTNHGNLYVDNPTLQRLVKAFDVAGWQVHFHAIGDRAVRTALDACETARRANGRGGNRHTITHNELIDPADYGRFAKHRVIASWQLQWAVDNFWTGPALHPYIGDERHDRLYPAGSVLAAGARMAGGSDWPVDPLGPWNQIATAVDRIGIAGLPEFGGTGQPLNPGEGISLTDSLDMHTRGSAYQLGQEAVSGTIEVGKDADLQILDIDVTTAPTSKVAFAEVRRTTLRGVTTYDATSSSSMTTPAKAKVVERAAARAGHGGCGCEKPHRIR